MHPGSPTEGLHTHTLRYIRTYTHIHAPTYILFDHVHTDNIRAYSTYKCNHINLVFMIDILHNSFVELCTPDKLVGCTT